MLVTLVNFQKSSPSRFTNKRSRSEEHGCKTGEDEYGLPVHTSMYKDLRYASALAMLDSRAEIGYIIYVSATHTLRPHTVGVIVVLGVRCEGLATRGYASHRKRSAISVSTVQYNTLPSTCGMLINHFFSRVQFFFAIFSSTEM